MLDRLTVDCQLLAVDPPNVSHAWDIAKPFIKRAYEAIDAPVPERMFNLLVEGRQLLWIVVDDNLKPIYVFVTELYTRPSGAKVCRLVCGAGERMTEWLALQSKLEAYARAEGCSKIVAEGRPGWARALDGYTEIRRVIEKDL